MAKKKQEITIRSSAAEYLTFIAATGESGIEAVYADENVWLTQKMMATLYDVEVNTINEHIKKIFSDNELNEEATIRKFRIVQNEGNRQVSREVAHYNLQMIIAVGFKVNNERAVQFRKWANKIVKDYTIQGWVMDVERLKKGGSVLDQDYFEKQLEKIREIRRERHSVGRTDKRSGRRYAPRFGTGSASLPRMRRRHFPRSLVPRPHCNAHSGV